MADVHTKQQRSKNMAAIKPQGNRSTESKFLELLRRNQITGWRRHYKFVKGKPDFVFMREKTAIFLDGCFWHGCPKCYKPPLTNRAFWQEKVAVNIERDKTVNKHLKEKNWKVARIWEHDLKKLPSEDWTLKTLETLLGTLRCRPE